MAKDVKENFLSELKRKFPSLKRASASKSLFEIPETSARIYVRYSKVHPGTKTFYGLRECDLRDLEGHRALLCFLWDGQELPLLIPYAAFEDGFHSIKPAQDGQFKVQVYPDSESTELYVSSAGRFNVEGYFGWNELNSLASPGISSTASQMTHSQVQTLLGAIGFAKGNDVWFPTIDRVGLDWNLTPKFPLQGRLPQRFAAVDGILSEIDVVWIKRGSGELGALFEVEHTTSIYSGLLRFNDVHLIAPDLKPRFGVVANDARRSLFVRQLNRPTFQRSGLAELCTFMEYANVLDWHERTKGAQQ